MSATGQAIRYVAGGTVQAGDGIYVERTADADALRLCREGAFAYILTSRQMGKSSLMVHTAQRLMEEGVKPVIVDLTDLGANTTADQWYRGFLEKISEQLELQVEVGAWWQSLQHISASQRLNRFIAEVVINEVKDRVVIFVDEIDTTLRLTFTDDFFASIRYLYNARATTPALARVSFVLLGVASPGDLMKDSERTPFNIGSRVELGDFTEADAVRDLHADPELVRSIFSYTSGHPYLTLRVFESLGNERLTTNIETRIESLFFGEQATKDSNLQFVRDMLTKRAPDREAVLLRYRDTWRGKNIRNREADPISTWLRLSGIVRVDDGALQIRNLIYRKVFDASWIRKNLRVNWLKAIAYVGATIVGLLVLILAILFPFAWKQRNQAVAAQLTAERQADIAEKERVIAQNATAAAKRSSADAMRQARLAHQAEADAKRQADRAENAEAEAEHASAVARAGQLTSQSLYTRAQHPNLIGDYLLLAVEAVRHAPLEDQPFTFSDGLPLLRRLKTGLVHQGVVRSAMFSADGRLVATVSDDKTASVFETASGREVTKFAHNSAVKCMAFSRDGRFVVTGSDDKTARIFEVATGKITSLEHQGAVNAVAFSPDGKLVATGSADNQSRVFQSTTGKQVARLIHDASVLSIAFSRDGRMVASGGEDKAARVLDVVTGKQIALVAYDGPVTSVAFSPAGSFVVAGSYDHTARLFDATNGKELVRLLHSVPVFSVVYSPDGRMAVTASGDGISINLATVFDTSTGKELSRFPLQDLVNSVAFSPDGRLVAAGSNDRTARVLEANTGREIARLPHRSPVSVVQFSPDGRSLVTCDQSKTVKIFDLVQGQSEVMKISAPGGSQSVVLSSDWRLAAINRGGGRAYIKDLTTGKQSALIGTSYYGPVPMAFSFDGKILAMAEGSTARVFDSRTAELRAEYDQPTSIECMALSANGSMLALSLADNTATVTDLSTGKEVAHVKHEKTVNSVTLSLNGRFLATGSSDTTVHVIDLNSKLEVAQVKNKAGINSVAFSPDGTDVASGGGDGTIRVIRILPKTEVAVFKNQAKVNSVAFSADGKLLVAGGQDGLARVFSISTKNEIGHIDGATEITSASFSRDGQMLQSVFSDGAVLLSPWRLEQIADYVCDHLTYNFSEQQWAQYRLAGPYRKTCPRLGDLP